MGGNDFRRQKDFWLRIEGCVKVMVLLRFPPIRSLQCLLGIHRHGFCTYLLGLALQGLRHRVLA